MNFKSVATLCIVLSAAQGGIAHANLVTNGGFETETLDGSGNPILPPPGWTISGNGIVIDTVFPNNGTYDAAFGAPSTDPSPGVLSQTIATTAGQAYNLSFALLDGAASASDAFTVSFGGLTQTITGDMASSYTMLSFVVPGADIAGAATALTFTGLNDSVTWNLDDVSVTAATSPIPEPSSSLLLASAVVLGCGSFAIRRRSSLT